MVDVKCWVTPEEPEIQKLAAELGSPQKIFDWMLNVRYVPGFYLIKPIEVLHRLEGDCDEQSVLLCSLLRAIGEEAFVRVAKVRNYPILHAWVVWKDPAYSYWRNKDPTGTISWVEDIPYGEEGGIPITMYVDFNDLVVYDYDGGLGQISHIFR